MLPVLLFLKLQALFLTALEGRIKGWVAEWPNGRMREVEKPKDRKHKQPNHTIFICF